MAEIDENLEECGIEELYQGPQQLPQTKKRYWARINDPGDSSFGKDALIPFEQFEAEREKILQRGGRPPSIKTRVEMPPGNGHSMS